HPEKKQTAQKLYASYGSVETLKDKGIEDPVSYYQAEVDRLNSERKKIKAASKEKQIGKSPMRYIGHFPFVAILNTLDIKKYLDLMQSVRQFQFNLYEGLEALVSARLVSPCSKHATFHDVLPCLYGDYNISYDQILSICDYMGSEYEKIVEILTAATAEKFGIDTSKTYFDCTNFYFEIDRETDFQKKGPSKENRHEPLVGLGLLLDANQIPISMRVFPGNESERPKLRQIISEMKAAGGINGRTIQVADKGLNCAENIHEAIKRRDGYIFSKSVKALPQTEKKWLLLDSGNSCDRNDPNSWTDVKDSDGNIRYRYKSCVDVFPYEYKDSTGKKHSFTIEEKRVVTYNPQLAAKQIFEIDREVAKARALCLSSAKKSQFGDSAKYVSFKSTSEGSVTDDRVAVCMNEDKIKEAKALAGYNMIVTSETGMNERQIYDAYHNLWKIEESFRIMKSELDARPVFLQKENSIKGHFLICYTAVLLERLLQYKILNEKYGAAQIMKLTRELQVVKVEGHKYVNITASGDVIKGISKELKFPITNYFLTDSQLNKMINSKLR
ncbi:MAG: IS1634 family transposase, partial [Oliverpabstia sp.]